MNPEHKKYILENMAKKSTAQIASELGIKERNVKKFIRMEDHVSKPSGAATVTGPKVPVKPVPVKKTMALASIILIIILGCAVYANSLNGKFVCDDKVLIEGNAFIENLSTLPKVFTEGIGKGAGKRYAFYRPIQIITYAIDYHVWKFNVAGYHLTNVFLHILVALCIYWLINILFGDKIISFLTAALFVGHPIHTTVVSYISTRAESLFLLFMLVSFIFYIKSLKTNSLICYIVMVSSYALALLSKENSLILPALILLYHYTFGERMRSREFLPITVLVFIYIILRTTVLQHMIAGVITSGTFLQRIPGFFVAVGTYVRLLFLPFGLHIEYGNNIFNFTDPKAISGLVILAGLIFCVFKTVKANRFVFFSLSWFLITLVPVSNLYPLNAYMSENWLYLPSIGFFLMLAGFLRALYKKEKYRLTAMVFTACLLALYSHLTFRQNKTWGEPIQFYERTLKYAPDSSMANINLAALYFDMGRKEEAVAMYKKALEIDPKQTAAYNNLGNIYYEMGKAEEAIAMYEKALEINTYDADTYYNLASAYDKTGRKEEAIPMYKKALEINPKKSDIYNNLGNAYDGTGKKEDAITMYKKAIEADPDNASAYYNLGIAYYNTGKKDDAISMYKKTIELTPDYADAYNNLGVAYFELGKREDAIAAFKKALEIDPNQADARRNLETISGGSK